MQTLIFFAVVLYGLTNSVGVAFGARTDATPGMVDLAQMCGLDGKSQCKGAVGSLSTHSALAKQSHLHFLNDDNTNTYLFAVDGDDTTGGKYAHIEIDLGASRLIEQIVIYAGMFYSLVQNAHILVLDEAGCSASRQTFGQSVNSFNNMPGDYTYITDIWGITGRYVCIERSGINSIAMAELKVLSLDVECPAYSHAPAGSRSTDKCVCAHGYEGTNGGKCTECMSGKYMPSTGLRACILCTESSGCECKAGWYGKLGLDCTQCPPHATSPPNSMNATSCVFVSTQACVDASGDAPGSCTTSALNYQPYMAHHRHIVDGDESTEFSVERWVSIDLLHNRMITGVRTISIEKSGVQAGVRVRVGTQAGCTGSVCVQNAVLGTMRSNITPCFAWGRYVCVEHGVNIASFHLAEVQVWAHPSDTTCPDNSHTEGGTAAAFWDLQDCVCDTGFVPGGAWCTQCNPGQKGCPSCAEIHETAGRTHRTCLVGYMENELFKDVADDTPVDAILMALSSEIQALLTPGFSLRIVPGGPKSVNAVVLRRGAQTQSWYPVNINPTHKSANAYRLVMPVAVA